MKRPSGPKIPDIFTRGYKAMFERPHYCKLCGKQLVYGLDTRPGSGLCTMEEYENEMHESCLKAEIQRRQKEKKANEDRS